MRIAVLSPSSTKQAAEMAWAIQAAGMEVLDFSWDAAAEKLKVADAFVLLADSDETLTIPAAEALSALFKTQNAKGKPVLGLGLGGARFLVENGLVPGLYKNLIGLNLVEKQPPGAEPTEALIRLSEDYQYNAFTRTLSSRECLAVQQCGRAEFVIPQGLLTEIKAQGLNVFLYCDAEGQPLPGNNIAALSNKAGSVMALLAYPEQTILGRAIFQSLQAHLASGYREQVEPLYYWPRK